MQFRTIQRGAKRFWSTQFAFSYIANLELGIVINISNLRDDPTNFGHFSARIRFKTCWDTLFKNRCLTRVWYVCGSHDPPDLLHWLEVGTEAAMTAENLLVNDGGDGETIETISKRFPQFDIKPSFACKVKWPWNLFNFRVKIVEKSRQIAKLLSYVAYDQSNLTIFFSNLTFIVESVYSVNTGTFMISSKQEKILWIFDLVCEQETNGLQTLFASIDVITQE